MTDDILIPQSYADRALPVPARDFDARVRAEGGLAGKPVRVHVVELDTDNGRALWLMVKTANSTFHLHWDDEDGTWYSDDFIAYNVKPA